MASVSDEGHSGSVYLKTPLPKVIWIGVVAAIFFIIASSHIISSWSARSGTNVDDYVYGVINRLDHLDPNKSTHSEPQDSAKMPPFSSESIGKLEQEIVSVAKRQHQTGMKSIPLSLTYSRQPISVESNSPLSPVWNSDGLAGILTGRSSAAGVVPAPYSRLNSVMPAPPLPTNSRQDDSSVNSSARLGSVLNSGRLESSAGGSPAAALSNKKECDLYHGKWVYDSRGPLYKNDSCPVLTQKQNCQGNGRPDKDYENWRWKPRDCEIPRFDARKFLDLMKGKTLAFVGDSLARNQMKSLLCILWQVEVPTSIKNKRMQRYDFASTSTTIIRIWSAWLVNITTDKFDFAPDGLDKLHLDVPDEGFMEFIPQFDVTVVNSGHWFSKKSAYILNNELVGGKSWWPKKSRKMKVDNSKALGMSMETILSAMVTHPDYTGLTVVRTYSPAHYEGGSWNTGGSCTGKLRPLKSGEIIANKLTSRMYDQQVRAFSRSIKKMTNKSKLKMMDITEAFGYRHDGHPGPYRNTDPDKITKPGRDGKPPPQDCGHWCMPGAVDTWNEILFEIIKREFNGKYDVPS
ncbi:OLC1v1018798C1 [Oldenlandia corymbosa var. corymbosa]|uniref:OLC1v1018798C1 n=1 Tax=Oldenlandia corymbosa var. corymbosa TaxID=529605 RepID=A0AAV1ECT5_OLDCO|nr:OLC1v1018798C1 [Oldenlandia corymbosa var. corymbosa]